MNALSLMFRISSSRNLVNDKFIINKIDFWYIKTNNNTNS